MLLVFDKSSQVYFPFEQTKLTDELLKQIDSEDCYGFEVDQINEAELDDFDPSEGQDFEHYL